MLTRPKFRLRLPDRELVLGERTLVMGVLNVTPDSFSDGGRYLSPDAAIQRAREMETEGADLIDVGGESTRPGSVRVGPEEELDRVLPVIEGLRGSVAIPISIDTCKPEVARAAAAGGAELINYVAMDPQGPMIQTVASLRIPIIIMHIRGTPDVMHQLPPLPDPLAAVTADLAALRDLAKQSEAQVLLDPGFGFGKNGEENYELLAGLSHFHELGCPLVVGTSRKSFIGKTLDAPPEGRLWGTAATVTSAILSGAHIVRVHDVAPMRQVARVADRILAHAKMTSGEAG